MYMSGQQGECVMDLCVCYYFVSLLHYVTDFLTILNMRTCIDSLLKNNFEYQCSSGEQTIQKR